MMKVPMQVEHVEFVAEEAYHATNLQNTSARNNLDLPPRYVPDSCQITVSPTPCNVPD